MSMDRVFGVCEPLLVQLAAVSVHIVVDQSGNLLSPVTQRRNTDRAVCKSVDERMRLRGCFGRIESRGGDQTKVCLVIDGSAQTPKGPRQGTCTELPLNRRIEPLDSANHKRALFAQVYVTRRLSEAVLSILFGQNQRGGAPVLPAD